MSQQSASSPGKKSRSRHSNVRSGQKSPWTSFTRQSQRQRRQLVVCVVVVLIAFILGFYFLGPSFSTN